MRKLSLNGTWNMTSSNGESCTGTVPGSVYSFLINSGRIAEPSYRDNEEVALQWMEQDFTFSRIFYLPKEWNKITSCLLCCEGLDTLCTVELNGTLLGQANNMHRIWEFDVTNAIQPGENKLAIYFFSPTQWIQAAYKADPLGGTEDAMRGFPHLRKAHCMFGWDWGPRLPDAGIWRDIFLLCIDGPRIEDFHVRQRHDEGHCWLLPTIRTDRAAETRIYLETPLGERLSMICGQETEVLNPLLWWPRGLGEQPLYHVYAEVMEHGRITDRAEQRIGLRTLGIRRSTDKWGESFTPVANQVPFFAMGADYVPEDNVLSRVTPERTRRLLEDCASANFNMIRVWGGGYYPDNFFFDACDELGLVVWQDFMFACACYRLTPEFEANIRKEISDNIRRIRHHACLGIWCGNNEMELFQHTGNYHANNQTRADYLQMFEHIIPEELRHCDPDTFYWPASPSSGGGFDEPNASNRGDVHNWEVWHAEKPFSAYLLDCPRFVSEFGFQSFPCLNSVERFTQANDRNLFSRIMERHQRNQNANGKLLRYLGQYYRYPTSFGTLLYTTQLLQAQAIRCGVEHWRRQRGCCMGTLYWQLNDIWPTASWSSIDYYGNWKALHYFAKRFYSPLLISCEKSGEMEQRSSLVEQKSTVYPQARLNVTNESHNALKCQVRWALRDHYGNPLRQENREVCVPAFSSVWMEALNFEDISFLEQYLSYELLVENTVCSEGTVLFTAPKYFCFADPQLSYEICGEKIIIHAQSYAQSVEISAPHDDLLLSDNYFDMNAGTKTIQIIRGKAENLRLRSVFDIQ